MMSLPAGMVGWSLGTALGAGVAENGVARGGASRSALLEGESEVRSNEPRFGSLGPM